MNAHFVQAALLREIDPSDYDLGKNFTKAANRYYRNLAFHELKNSIAQSVGLDESGALDEGKRKIRRMSRILALLILAFSLLTQPHGAQAQSHPDYSRFEYRYIDGAFVAPYDSFPVGKERSQWKCYDGENKRTMNCTFVHRGFERFQYIFRSR